MSEIIIPIPARLKNVAKGGHVAGAEDIIDDVLNKEQSVINQETLSRLDTVQQKVDDIGDSIQFDEDGDLVTEDGGDFSDDTARGKIPTIGAIKDGADAVPTAGSHNLVKSGGVSNSILTLEMGNILYNVDINSNLVGSLGGYYGDDTDVNIQSGTSLIIKFSSNATKVRIYTASYGRALFDSSATSPDADGYYRVTLDGIAKIIRVNTESIEVVNVIIGNADSSSISKNAADISKNTSGITKNSSDIAKNQHGTDYALNTTIASTNVAQSRPGYYYGDAECDIESGKDIYIECGDGVTSVALFTANYASNQEYTYNGSPIIITTDRDVRIVRVFTQSAISVPVVITYPKGVNVAANSNDILKLQLVKDVSDYGTTQGMISPDGTEIWSQSNVDVTGFIPVKEGDKILYSGRINNLVGLVWGYASATMANPVKLLQGVNSQLTDVMIVIPNGVNYVRAQSRNMTHAETPTQLVVKKINGDLLKDQASVRSYIIVDANGYGDYTSIDEAIDNAGDTATLHKTIIVMPGEYETGTLTAATRGASQGRNLSIVGVSKTACILYNNKAIYKTEPVSEFADNAVLKLTGNLYIANLTLISGDSEFPEGMDEFYRKSYCIHIDGDIDGDSVAEIHNCIMKNNHSACCGIGLRDGYTVRITDCIMESAITESLGRMYGVVEGHDWGESATADRQQIMVKDCLLHNTSGTTGIRWKRVTSPSTVHAINNVIKTTDNDHAVYIVGNSDGYPTLGDMNYGNNIQGLNTLQTTPDGVDYEVIN